jgi:SRSO17 transposase
MDSSLLDGIAYLVGVRPATSVWWGEHRPAPAPAPRGRGRPRTRLVRDEAHQPITVLELAQALSAKSFRSITWREGTAQALRSRFARVRVNAAHYNRPGRKNG